MARFTSKAPSDSLGNGNCLSAANVRASNASNGKKSTACRLPQTNLSKSMHLQKELSKPSGRSSARARYGGPRAGETPYAAAAAPMLLRVQIVLAAGGPDAVRAAARVVLHRLREHRRRGGGGGRVAAPLEERAAAAVHTAGRGGGGRRVAAREHRMAERREFIFGLDYGLGVLIIGKGGRTTTAPPY